MKKFEIKIENESRIHLIKALESNGVNEYSVYNDDGKTMVSFKCEPYIMFNIGVDYTKNQAAK